MLQDVINLHDTTVKMYEMLHIHHVAILEVFGLVLIINFQSIDFFNHYIVRILRTIFILMNCDRLENIRSWTRSLV